MDMKQAFNIFLIIGAILLLAAVVVLVVMIYRYIVSMRAQGFFGGHKNDEEV
jgi:hypothetical protein